MQNNTILITGGTGYIGSHTYVELLKHYPNNNIVIVDNLSNSKIDVIDAIKNITKKNDISFYNVDLLDKDALDNIFKLYKPYAVIHFAGLKSVSESISNPELYYKNNIVATITLLEIMQKYLCYNLIFSSSATVYGSGKSPLSEDSPIGIGITNPYGRTKYMLECILQDYCVANEKLNVIALRYFNPIGAHSSGLIGENPNDTPNNLMPYLLKVASTNNKQKSFGEKFDILNIFGNDYETNDGTCERDFIHVVDLAKAHVSALKSLTNLKHYQVFNVGTGKSTSVLELLRTFEKVNKVNIPFKFQPRREGDIAICFCNPGRTHSALQWKAGYTIEDMCRDAWKYQMKHMK